MTKKPLILKVLFCNYYLPYVSNTSLIYLIFNNLVLRFFRSSCFLFIRLSGFDLMGLSLYGLTYFFPIIGKSLSFCLFKSTFKFQNWNLVGEDKPSIIGFLLFDLVWFSGILKQAKDQTIGFL